MVVVVKSLFYILECLNYHVGVCTRLTLRMRTIS